jgi:hypothetical protein
MRITWEEMQLLTGTDIVVQMIRCKLDAFDHAMHPDDVLKYVKEHAVDMWCERDGIFYFCSAVDRANALIFCQEYVETNLH